MSQGIPDINYGENSWFLGKLSMNLFLKILIREFHQEEYIEIINEKRTDISFIMGK